MPAPFYIEYAPDLTGKSRALIASFGRFSDLSMESSAPPDARTKAMRQLPPYIALLLQAVAMALPVSGLWPTDMVERPVATMASAALALAAVVPTLHVRAPVAPRCAASRAALSSLLTAWTMPVHRAQTIVLGMPSEYGRQLKAAEVGWRALSALIRGALCFHVLAVLMGAPLASRCLHTLAWALLMASYTAVPACCRWGSVDPSSPAGAGWSRCFVHARPLSRCEDMAVALPCYGALIGAWLGGCAGPLDWDTAWQVWPIASGFGTCGGAATGAAAAAAACMMRSPDSGYAEAPKGLGTKVQHRMRLNKK